VDLTLRDSGSVDMALRDSGSVDMALQIRVLWT